MPETQYPRPRSTASKLATSLVASACDDIRKSVGSKRREIPTEAIDEIAHIFGDPLNGDDGWDTVSKVFPTSHFGYTEIRVERPLKLATCL